MANNEPGGSGAAADERVPEELTLSPPGPGGFDDTVLDDENWPTAQAKRGVRLRTPTAVLAALVLLAGGFWGGAILQKNEGSSGTGGFAASRSSLTRSLFSRSGGSSFFGSTGSRSAATVGTVTDVIGKALYVTNSSGDLVKVTLGPSAKVTRNADSTLADLKIGDTVIIEGVKSSSGALTASSIAATAAGVSSGLGSTALTGG
ncbi:MAG TPA: hypothetical protein VED84_02695 [Acidimicrobiales bacterium]|nr:hypothetical protein [Acidimicrobiales bacterium]